MVTIERDAKRATEPTSNKPSSWGFSAKGGFDLTLRDRLVRFVMDGAKHWGPRLQEDGSYKSVEEQIRDWLAKIDRAYPEDDPDGIRVSR